MNTHSFDVAIAKEVGVNAATILWNLAYLQLNHEAQGRMQQYYDDKWWCNHTVETLTKWHSYLSTQQVRTATKKLLDAGYVIKGSYGSNPFDRTTCWHVTSQAFAIMNKSDMSSVTNVHLPKATNVIHKNNTKHIYNPPTLDEVKAYAKSRNSNVNPKDFFDFYDAGNWHDGKGNQVKNWKQKFITWEKNQKPTNTDKKVKFI